VYSFANVGYVTNAPSSWLRTRACGRSNDAYGYSTPPTACWCVTTRGRLLGGDGLSGVRGRYGCRIEWVISNEPAAKAGVAWQEWQGSAFARVRSGVRPRDEFRSTMLFERTDAN
jgi:hypothetical protein